MSKGLESLERLKNTLLAEGYWQDILQDVAIVEKELKEYEEMKRIKGTTTFDKAIEDTLINSCPNVAKKLKAFEIIKKYNIRPSDYHYHTTYNIYLCNMSFVPDDEIMSEEEYNLLKEVLNA